MEAKRNGSVNFTSSGHLYLVFRTKPIELWIKNAMEKCKFRLEGLLIYTLEIIIYFWSQFTVPSHRDATNTHTCKWIHMQAHTHTYCMHTCKLTYTHMCIHKHIHTMLFPTAGSVLMAPLHFPAIDVLGVPLRVANPHSCFSTCLNVILLKNTFPGLGSINTSTLKSVIWFEMVCLLIYLLCYRPWVPEEQGSCLLTIISTGVNIKLDKVNAW